MQTAILVSFLMGAIAMKNFTDTKYRFPHLSRWRYVVDASIAAAALLFAVVALMSSER